MLETTSATVSRPDRSALAASQGYLDLSGYHQSSTSATKRFIEAGKATHELREHLLARGERRMRTYRKKQLRAQGTKAARRTMRDAQRAVYSTRAKATRPNSAAPASRTHRKQIGMRPTSSLGARSVAREPRITALPATAPRIGLGGLRGDMDQLHAFVRGAASAFESARRDTRLGLLGLAQRGARRVRIAERLDHEECRTAGISQPWSPMDRQRKMPVLRGAR